MLQVAKGKKIFKKVICEYLGPQKLDIEDGMIKQFLHKKRYILFFFKMKRFSSN